VLENLSPDTLPRLLRRTTVSALFVGAIGFIVALLIAPPQGALGVAIGLVLAIVNLRFLDRQVAKVETHGEQSTKAVRRQLGGRTIARLALMTGVVLVAVVISPPLGVGIVAGLVLYQIVFVANVFRVVATQGGIE
jgi:membrane protein implicated in regulation of membrane protease activity